MVAKAPTDINFASTTYPLAYINMQGGYSYSKDTIFNDVKYCYKKNHRRYNKRRIVSL